MDSAPKYSLGPMPWSDEAIVSAVWRDFRSAQEWVEEHPGFDITERIESLQAVLAIFGRAADSFSAELTRFHEASEGGVLFRRNRRPDLKAFEDRFRELLYVYCSAAMTLVDQARALSKKVVVPEYDTRVRQDFASNQMHRFVQELRVDVVHVSLHRPGWQLNHSVDDGRTSSFMIWPKQLRRAKDYNAHAKAYLESHPDGINLGRLVTDYTLQVRSFHKWFRNGIDVSAGTIIADYKRCITRLKSVSSRSMWNLVLQQIVIGGKRDPYAYLDQYLTAVEHQQVLSLPHRSREQVDRIIQIIDEYGACDDALRTVAYKAFGVAE